MLAGLVFTIMEDVMELSTIEEAQGVFGYLESRIKKLRQVLHPSFRKRASFAHPVPKHDTMPSSAEQNIRVIRMDP